MIVAFLSWTNLWHSFHYFFWIALLHIEPVIQIQVYCNSTMINRYLCLALLRSHCYSSSTSKKNLVLYFEISIQFPVLCFNLPDIDLWVWGLFQKFCNLLAAALRAAEQKDKHLIHPNCDSTFNNFTFMFLRLRFTSPDHKWTSKICTTVTQFLNW